jgi:hypothetical protein
VLDTALPDPYSFDHAIVRVKIGQQTFWVDGTAEKRLSPLSVDSPASYGWALVVDGSTTGLENIPQPAADAAGKKSEVLIDMSAGMSKPAKLQITTSYLGRWADSQREELADGSPQQRQSRYVNYIAGYYPGARTAAPIAINDDKVNNIVTVSEYYELPQTFKLKNGRQRFFVQVDELYRYAGNLNSSVRTSPLAIAYPADVEQRIRVILPQKWSVRNDAVKIDNPAFHYSSTVNYVDRGSSAEVVLDYKYRALTDFVELKALAQYQTDRKRVDDDLGYYIGPPKQSPNVTRVVFVQKLGLAPVPMWWMILALALATYLAVRYGYRWDPEPKPTQPGGRSGIRGWLIPFAFIAAVGPVAWAALLRVSAGSFDVQRWSHLSELVPHPFKSGVQSALLLLGGAGVMLLVGFVLVAVLFFTKRSSAPLMFISVHWTSIGWSLVEGAYLSACHLEPHISWTERLWAGRWDLGALALYTAYFVLSKRVRATFVRRFPGERSRKAVPLTDAVAPSSG